MTSTTTDIIDGVSTSTAQKPACKAATTANITLSGEQTIDGVSIVSGDRVLVKDQTDATENGIYKASASAWSRAEDFDGNRDIRKGTMVLVHSGSTYAGVIFRVTTADSITIGTSSINFSATEFSSATLFDGQPSSYYTNSSNQGSGTLPNARLSAEITNLIYFYASESSPAAMTVELTAGKVFRHGTLTSKAAQTTSTITAPTGDPRIDRVIVDKTTGIYDIIAGTEAATPSAPSIPSNSYPVCQISLTVGMTEIEDADITDERTFYNGGTLPRGYISGFVPSPGGDADHDITFSEGECRSSDNTADCVPTWSSITKQIDAAWAEGTNQGGMATGSVANTTDYHYLLIRKDSDPSVFDIVIDTSISGINAPSGWTVVRRVDSRRTNSSANIIPFSAIELPGGGLQSLIAPTFQFSKDWSGAEDTAQTGTFISLPGGIKVIAEYSAWFIDASISANSAILFSSLDQPDTALNITSGSYIGDLVIQSGQSWKHGRFRTRTNTSRAIRYRTINSTVDHYLDVCLHGWEDTRV